MARQTVFGFFEVRVNAAASGVESLMRFTASGKFDDKITYSKWLSWFTPLSHDWNEGLELFPAQAITFGRSVKGGAR